MKNNKANFLTPNGLKVRLNCRYFFYQLTKVDRYYTNEEIVDNETMYNAVKTIENLYVTATALIQAFSIVAIFFHIDMRIFCIVMALLYLFGSVLRYSKHLFPLGKVSSYIGAIYKKTWFLFYIALGALFFMLDCKYLIVPYLIMRASIAFFSLNTNQLIALMTKERYGVHFYDTEICAFNVFYNLLHSDKKFSDYIKEYIDYNYNNECVDTKTV